MSLKEDIDKRFSWLMRQYEAAKVAADGARKEIDEMKKADISLLNPEEKLRHYMKGMETERTFYILLNYSNLLAVALSDYDRVQRIEENLGELSWLSAKLEENKKEG